MNELGARALERGIGDAVDVPAAGVYMRYFAHVPDLADAPRLMFRSRFLFLLLIALVNLAMSYAHPQSLLQRAASALVLAAPVPLIAAFFVDPKNGVHGSLWTAVTMRALFLAAMLLCFVNRPRRD